MNYCFDVNGYEIHASFDEKDIQDTFIPLLMRWHNLRKEKGKRIIVGIAGCPGSGKSTLVSFLSYLYSTLHLDYSMVSIGMDGFHYSNAYLKEHHLEKEKGSQNTFDFEKLKNTILKTKENNCWWPIYSRQIHDPIENQVYIDSDIVLIEGNYLLSDVFDASVFDDTLFVYVDIEELKPRLIERKARGYSIEDAISFYESSDKKNIEYVLAHKRSANATLTLKKNRVVKFTLKEK